MKKIALFLVTIFWSLSLLAASIQGHVKDEKGRPLSFAAVQVKGTNTGAMADAQGFYQLSLAPGKYVLLCQYTAYEPVEKTITVGNDNQVIDFQLKPQHLSLNEVVIKANAEDPAYAIMRQVIAKRKYHDKLLKTLETDIYLKGNLHVDSFRSFLGIKIPDSDRVAMGLDSTGSGILYLLEERSHYTYQSPDKEFNKVLSVRVSGDPQGLGFATMPSILNVYQNNMNVLGLNSRGFISPANSGAFHYYKFKYLGSFQQYGRTISKIQVIPKRKYEPLFSGVVYVAEGDWVFQNINLVLTKTAQISGVDTVRLTQTFAPSQKDIWVIQNQVLGLKLHVLGLSVSGNFLTIYQNQKVNEPVDEQLFAQKVVSAYDSTALSKDSAYWEAQRPVAMKAEEIRNFRFKDSVARKEQAAADSAYLVPHFHLSPLGFLLGNPGVDYKGNEWSMRPLLAAIQFNSVEGLSATLDLGWRHEFEDTAKVLTVNWLNRYGFSNHHFNSLLHFGMRYGDIHWRQRYFSWRLTAGQYVYQFNGNNPIMPIMNELYTLFAGRNYLKLYENRLLRLDLKRNWGNGLLGALSLSYEQRTALSNTTDYTFGNKNNQFITPNLPAGAYMIDGQQAAIAHFFVSYQPGVRYVQYPQYKQPYFGGSPVFSLDYSQGVGIAKATAQFAKWRLAMTDDMRLRMGGHLAYKLAGGGFLNKKEVSFPDAYHINGNQTFLAGPYLNSFQLAPYYRFSNMADLYGEAHLEWHLDGLLTNKVPVFRKLNWFLLTGGNLLYINQGNYYGEVFVGLDNIGWGFLRMGRIDIIAGYESASAKPSVGLRVSFGGLFNMLFGTQSVSDL